MDYLDWLKAKKNIVMDAWQSARAGPCSCCSNSNTVNDATMRAVRAECKEMSQSREAGNRKATVDGGTRVNQPP